jgi:hypothetical protein
MKNKLTGGIHPAVVAVWAAICAAGFLLPTVPIWGTGSVFSVSSALAPLSGIFFGPIAGALCSAAGGFIGSLIAPHTAWMGLGTFIIGTVTAFTAGCIAWGDRTPITINKNGSFIVSGGIIVYITGTVLWFTQETGRNVLLLPLVSYTLGFAVMITGIIFAKRIFTGKSRLLKFPAIWLCAFGGLTGGASIGNFFSLLLYDLPGEIWKALAVVQPVERAIFALGAAFIGAPLLEGLNKIGISAGPQLAGFKPEEEEDED